MRYLFMCLEPGKLFDLAAENQDADYKRHVEDQGQIPLNFNAIQ